MFILGDQVCCNMGRSDILMKGSRVAEADIVAFPVATVEYV